MSALPPPRPNWMQRIGAAPEPSPLRVAGGALVGWWRAVTLDALIVGILWLVGLEVLRVPWAPFWALLGAVFQFVPAFGGMLAVSGPAITAALSAQDDVLFHVAMVLGLYAIIVVLEGLVIQPLILHRTTLVPWWASLLGPIVLGLVFPPWGVLLAPPLMAVIFAFTRRRRVAR